MSKNVLEILKKIQAEYGENIFIPANRRQLKGLLLDYTKNKHSGEVYLILEGLALEIWQSLKKQAANLVKAQNIYFKQLTEEYCLTEAGARYIIEVFSVLVRQACQEQPQLQEVSLRQAN